MSIKKKVNKTINIFKNFFFSKNKESELYLLKDNKHRIVMKINEYLGKKKWEYVSIKKN